jgi:hypothetical protein
MINQDHCNVTYNVTAPFCGGSNCHQVMAVDVWICSKEEWFLLLRFRKLEFE